MPRYRKVLFLDTCSLHHMRLYCDFARRRKLKPLGNRLANPESEIDRENLNSKTASDLKIGYKLLVRLQTESQKGNEVLFAPLTKVEMHCGLLRGEAIVGMAENLAPNRLFSRIDEEEVFKLLQESEYTKKSKVLNKMLNSFRSLGININEVDLEKSREAYIIAADVLTKIYLDAFDLIIYAYSLVVQAEELFTQDGYLKRIANCIQNPGSLQAGWLNQQQQFRDAKIVIAKKLSNLIGTQVSKIKFPRVSS